MAVSWQNRRNRPEKRFKASQLALAWVLAQGEDIVPIPGTKRRQYLQENVAALDIVLTPEVIEQINQVSPQDAATGDRMNGFMGDWRSDRVLSAVQNLKPIAI